MELASGWHELKLDFGSGHARLELDGSEVKLPPIAPIRAQFIGFRSGRKGARIDRVRVAAADGSQVVEEGFRNRDASPADALRRWAPRGLLFFGGAALLCLFWPRSTQWVQRLLLLQASLLILLVLYFGFDYWVWSGRYPYQGFTPSGRVGSSLPVHFEDLRSELSGTHFTPESGQARVATLAPHPLIARSTTAWDRMARAPHQLAYVIRSDREPVFVARDRPEEWPPKAAGEVRIAIIGTSQTYGEGAELLGDTLAVQIHQGLAATKPPPFKDAMSMHLTADWPLKVSTGTLDPTSGFGFCACCAGTEAPRTQANATPQTDPKTIIRVDYLFRWPAVVPVWGLKQRRRKSRRLSAIKFLGQHGVGSRTPTTASRWSSLPAGMSSSWRSPPGATASPTSS